MKREVCDKPIFCHHCEEAPREFVAYVEANFITYCSSCMYAYEKINKTQFKVDKITNLSAYKTFLQKELKQCTKDLAEISGSSLDNED
jgi:hypothetical protein